MAATTRTMALLGMSVLIGGCTSLRPPVPTPSTETAVSQSDTDLAEAMAYFARGKLAQGLEGNREMAAVFFEKAARLFPRNLGLVVLAAQSLAALDENERSQALLQWAAPYHADSSSAQYELGRFLWDIGDRDAARLYFNEAMRIDPTNPQSYLGLAFLMLRAGDTAGAQEMFNAALQRAPDNPLPYIGLAMSALETDDADAALDIVEQAIGQDITDPALTHFFREFAIVLISRGSFSDALAPLEALQALEPDDLDTHHMTALVYARLERHDEAYEALQRWPKASEQPATVADLLAQIYETGDDLARAIDYALKAVAEMPDTPLIAWLRAGRLLLMDGRAEEAATIMAGATEHYPDDAVAWMYRGLAYSAIEKHQDAVAALERTAAIAQRMDPDEFALPTRFDFWIGAAYERVERIADAERHFRRSIAAYPEIHEAFNYLAYMWAEKAMNLDEAEEMVQVALEAEPDNSAYIDTLGWIYYQQGHYEKALETLRRALDKMPDHPTIIDHVGDALHALERTEEAIAYWKKSYNKDPTNEDIYEKLKREGVDMDALKPPEEQ